MPRPPRCRRIGGYPDHWCFAPEDDADETEEIILTLDEYETLRLMDHQGLTQEQCAARMGVGRTTVTAIYESARKKLARFLVEGLRLRLAGGSYSLANENEKLFLRKGNQSMRIAVTYENGEVFQHFGHTAQFKVYDAEDGKIVSEQVVDTNGSGHGALAGFLQAGHVDALICGGIGMGARNALAEAGIKLYPGITGSADEAAKALAEGTLKCDPDAHCDHHGHGEGEEGHCGHHGHGHGEEGHCGHHGHGEGEEGHCGRHGHGHGESEEGHCGHHGHGHGEDGHCGHHGHGEGEEGHCGRHGHGHGEGGRCGHHSSEQE